MDWRPDDAGLRADLRARSRRSACSQGPANNNEDCLYLNVFTPNLDPSARLPVIVWIHGGGNVDGETPGYDGSKMASDGKTVVVTMEYRLNLMGFLAHPALDDEGHLFANYGILDQQAALKWVQAQHRQVRRRQEQRDPWRPVRGRGGHRIQHGVAAGYRLVPAGDLRKLLPRDLTTSLPTLASAEAKGVAFSVAAGCGSGTGSATAKCLRNLTAAQVEALAGTASANSQYIIRRMLDGQILPIQPHRFH